MNIFLSKLAQGILTVAISLSSFLSPTVATHTIASQQLGAAPQFTAGKLYSLYGSGIASTDTSIKLTSFTQPVSGTPFLTADLVGGAGSIFYATLEPSTNRKEQIGCTGVTQNSDGTAYITGCTRGLSFAYPYTASTTLRLSHSGGSRVVLSDSPQVYQSIIDYVNSSMAAGTVDSSPTAKGVVEVAAASEASSHAQNGSGNTTAYLTLTSNISSSTRQANTPLVVVSSSTDGYIDNSFINPTTLLSGQTLTGTTTFTNVVVNNNLTGQQGVLYGAGWKLIGSSTPTGSTNTFTFSNIATSSMLKATIYVVDNNALLSNDLSINFNGDTGANYTYQLSTTSAGTIKAATAINDTLTFGAVRGYRYVDMTILNQATTTKPFYYHTQIIPFPISTSTMIQPYDTSGFWASSTGQIINKISVTGTGASAWDSSSVMYLYGSTF